MNGFSSSVRNGALTASLSLSTIAACSGTSTSTEQAIGGSFAIGGASVNTGVTVAGGPTTATTPTSTGGTRTTSTGVSASGGVLAQGGQFTAPMTLLQGGVNSFGGAASGGVQATGGSTSMGGTFSKGGSTASGGTSSKGGTSSSSGSPATGGSGNAICPTTILKAGDSTQVVTVGTLTRSYVLHIPTGYAGTKPLSVVIDFHPLGGTGAGWEGANPWKAKADSAGFIMVYPNSYNSNNSWNAGMCCQDAQHNSIDDVGFTRAIVKHVQTIACVDPKRIYATGCSNGGGMTYKVACDAADIIAAAAPVDFRCVYGGTTSSPSCDGCKPSRPISVTHFDNTGDTSLVPFGGGMTSFPADCPPNQSCTGMGFPSAQANFVAWQSINSCTGASSTLNGHAACQTNSTCQGSSQVNFCVQQGGSHCGNYASLGIVDIAWETFQRTALP